MQGGLGWAGVRASCTSPAAFALVCPLPLLLLPRRAPGRRLEKKRKKKRKRNGGPLLYCNGALALALVLDQRKGKGKGNSYKCQVRNKHKRKRKTKRNSRNLFFVLRASFFVLFPPHTPGKAVSRKRHSGRRTRTRRRRPKDSDSDSDSDSEVIYEPPSRLPLGASRLSARARGA